MRSHTTFILLVSLGLALANPLNKIEKRSIADTNTAESDLDGTQQFTEDDIMQALGSENVDRAKKQASTTFCVEIRQNKPVQVDCDEVNNRPQPGESPAPVPLSIDPEPAPAPAPAPAPSPAAVPIHIHHHGPGSLPIHPHSSISFQPQPQPSVSFQPQPQPSISFQPQPQPSISFQPQPQPESLNIEVPCEPEMAAYVVQPPEHVVYAPTGNCVPQAPAPVPATQVVHVPVPAPGSAPVAPSTIQVLHLNSGPTGPSGTGGLPSLHHHHSLIHGKPTLKPLHSLIHHHSLPQANGIECTCKSNGGQIGQSRAADDWRSADWRAADWRAADDWRSADWRAADDWRSADWRAADWRAVDGQKPAARYLPRPLTNMQQVTYQQQSQMGGMGGMTGGMPIMGGYPMGGIYPMSGMMHGGMMPILRTQGGTLEGSFPNKQVIQGVRLSRGPDESESPEKETPKDTEAPKEEKKEEDKPSSNEKIDQLKIDDKVDEKSARIARFLMSEKDEESNKLED